MTTSFGVSNNTSPKGTEYTVTRIKPFVFAISDDMCKVRSEYLEFANSELKGIQDYVKSCLINADK